MLGSADQNILKEGGGSEQKIDSIKEKDDTENGEQ